MKRNIHFAQVFIVTAALLVASSGCSKSPKEITASATPPQPKEAASQIQQAFTAAPPEVKKSADVVSESLRTADYEQAIKSLEVKTTETTWVVVPIVSGAAIDAAATAVMGPILIGD